MSYVLLLQCKCVPGPVVVCKPPPVSGTASPGPPSLLSPPWLPPVQWLLRLNEYKVFSLLLAKQPQYCWHSVRMTESIFSLQHFLHNSTSAAHCKYVAEVMERNSAN